MILINRYTLFQNAPRSLVTTMLAGGYDHLIVGCFVKLATTSGGYRHTVSRGIQRTQVVTLMTGRNLVNLYWIL
ncbi:hypothetical protein DL546_002951 [Coniochaeta pulveracea]|uniref:Uncharacterized protein n=1 Tax=Coniochaeta pulveracea TaxID=177199 RepID=A0A420XXM6_9PEZI|nr:hypothetical protein DL546_002951 [Coniochaeta pulveracea]